MNTAELKNVGPSMRRINEPPRANRTTLKRILQVVRTAWAVMFLLTIQYGDTRKNDTHIFT